jgi:hypothetical protein
MAGGQGGDPTTHYAALQERVSGLGQQFLHFEQTTTRAFQQVETAIAGLSAEVRAGGKTQWQTIVTSVGVIVAILGALGGLAYLPVRNGMEALGSELRILRDATVPRTEQSERWRRTEDDIRGLAAELRLVEARAVGRAEYEERWRCRENK